MSLAKGSSNVEIINAVFTPMHRDGSLNFDRIPRLFEHTVKTLANGVFLNGTTGEGMSLSHEERMTLVEHWVACKQRMNRPEFKIIAHVGSCNLREAGTMAEHAQACGADGIAMVATFYYKPRTIGELVDQCAYVAAAAKQTPFYYYNIPFYTGVNLPLLKFLEVATQHIPNFAGLKNSFTDLEDYKRCIHFAKEKYTLYWGTDESFMTLYAAGNRHYVGSTYNYMGHIYRQMLKAYQAGDSITVGTLQGEADAIYKIMSTHNDIAAGKEIMQMIGIDCGPVRLPLKRLLDEERKLLLAKLRTTTLFDHLENSLA